MQTALSAKSLSLKDPVSSRPKESDSIDTLGLSAWVLGILHVGGISTVEELLSKLKNEALLANYLGRRSLEEIKAVLEQKDYL